MDECMGKTGVAAAGTHALKVPAHEWRGKHESDEWTNVWGKPALRLRELMLSRYRHTNGEGMTRMGLETEQSELGNRVLYAELSYRLMSAVFAVHNELGPGFGESVYERVLCRELEDLGIPFECQKPIEIHYRGDKVGDYRLDIVVDGTIIVELKAVSELSDLFEAQVFSYLKASGLRLGILVNFGKKRVEYKRIVL